MNREAIRRTASTAPGMSGRCSQYRAAIAPMTTWATSSGGSRTPSPELRYRDHSPVLMPISRFWVSGSQCPP